MMRGSSRKATRQRTSRTPIPTMAICFWMRSSKGDLHDAPLQGPTRAGLLVARDIEKLDTVADDHSCRTDSATRRSNRLGWKLLCSKPCALFEEQRIHLRRDRDSSSL